MKMLLCFITVFLVTGVGACAEFKQLAKDLGIKHPASPAAPLPKKEISVDTNTDDVYTGEVMGKIENIHILNTNLPAMKAKLDPFLITTVLDTQIINSVREGDKEYVTYHINADSYNKEEFRKEVVRWESSQRPVVVMELCIGKERIMGEVSLAHNEHFLYPILVGNNILNNRVIVDDSKTFTTTPQCG